MNKPILTLALIASALTLSACAEVIDAKAPVRELSPGQTVFYTLKSDVPLLVGFEHVGSQETALSCQGKRANPNALPLPHCGGVYQSDGKKIVDGSRIESLHGGKVTFEPKNGEIKVAMKNIAKIPMKFALVYKTPEG